jgi:hypothetical protein
MRSLQRISQSAATVDTTAFDGLHRRILRGSTSHLFQDCGPVDHSKLSRNFDFKIRAESNSVADCLKLVEDVAGLSRVLHSTSCGCNLYRGGCPKAVKSFLGYNWGDLIRVEQLKRYIPGTNPKKR